MRTAAEIIRSIRGSLSQPAVQARVREAFPHVTGVIPTALSHWESGRRSPPPLQLYAIYDVSDSRPPQDELLLLLTELGRLPNAVGREYHALISSWAPGLDVHGRVSSFLSWARAHASRPPRGRRDGGAS